MIPCDQNMLYCINQAAIEFNIPSKLIIAVLDVEQGKVGKVSKNKNGTYDIGPMQVNSTWLSELKRYGISEEELLNDPCVNVRVGAWLLAKAIAEENSLLKGIGDYHSHTAWRNNQYVQNVRVNFTKLTRILSNPNEV